MLFRIKNWRETPVPKASDIKAVVQKALKKESWALLDHALHVFGVSGFFIRRHFSQTFWLISAK